MFANNFIIIFNGCLEPIKWRELCVIFCIAARAKSRKTVSFREELWLLRCRKVWVEVGWTFKIPDAFCICLCGHESNEIYFLRVFGHSVARVLWGKWLSRNEERVVYAVVLFSRVRSRKTVFFMRKLFLGRCRNTCVI